LKAPFQQGKRQLKREFGLLEGKGWNRRQKMGRTIGWFKGSTEIRWCRLGGNDLRKKKASSKIAEVGGKKKKKAKQNLAKRRQREKRKKKNA